MSCACCWEDFDLALPVAHVGPVEITEVVYLNADGAGIRHYAWLYWPDLDVTAPDLRELAAHLHKAADLLDRLNSGSAR